MAKLRYEGKGIIWGDKKIKFDKNGIFETTDNTIQSLLKKKGFKGTVVKEENDDGNESLGTDATPGGDGNGSTGDSTEETK